MIAIFVIRKNMARHEILVVGHGDSVNIVISCRIVTDVYTPLSAVLGHVDILVVYNIFSGQVK